MIRKFEVVIKFKPDAAEPAEGIEMERVLFTITNSRPQAESIADALRFLAGQLVTGVYVRAAYTNQDQE